MYYKQMATQKTKENLWMQVTRAKLKYGQGSSPIQIGVGSFPVVEPENGSPTLPNYSIA